MRPFKLVNILFVILLIVLDAGYFFYGIDWWWIAILIFIYVSLLVLGAIYIQWNFYLVSLSKGRDKQKIALTFDDGPGAETTAILDILKEQNVKAAFFNIGKNAAANKDLLKRYDAEGHVVGNHSYHHGFNFDWKSARAMKEELQQTNELIRQVIGRQPKLFRPPYGVTNPNLARAVKAMGMHSIGWNLRSFDTKAKDPGKLLQKVLGSLKGGDIILFHDTMPVTRQILTELIIQARKKGFTFARVDELLDIDAYA